MLSSKERVLMTFNHEEPDRVPIDYASNPGIDLRLKKHLGLAPDDHVGLLRRLGVDFYPIHRDRPEHYQGPKLHPNLPDRQINEWGIRCRWVENESGGYWDYCDFPLAEADAEELAAWPMPRADDYDFDGVLEECIAHEEFCLYVGHPGIADIINCSGMVRGMEQTLVDLVLEDEAFLAWVDRRLDVQAEILRRIIELAQGRISFLWMGEDLGTQLGPMISPDTYRSVLRPRHQRFIDLAKSYGLPVMIHSCGSSSWAFDDFIGMGVDAVDTLQPEAAHMAPASLKEQYGDRLAFHGCISTAGPVATGTEEETVADARTILDIMKPGGGYCFAPTHCLQDNSRTENVLALYELAREYGRY